MIPGDHRNTRKKSKITVRALEKPFLPSIFHSIYDKILKKYYKIHLNLFFFSFFIYFVREMGRGVKGPEIKPEKKLCWFGTDRKQQDAKMLELLSNCSWYQSQN